jgi:hypothetical protein
MTTRVIFRIDVATGDAIAVFPDDTKNGLITIYDRKEQHTECDRGWYQAETREPRTDEERAKVSNLREKLEGAPFRYTFLPTVPSTLNSVADAGK